MPSTYSTDLKLELMVTGEKAGLWGDITNTNLNIVQQAIAGYESVTLNATTGATLLFSNGTISNGKNAVLNLAGTITTSVNVVIPDGIEKNYIIKNATSGNHAVVFKTTSGTGATWAGTDKGTKFVYSDGTNVVDVNAAINTINQFTLPAADGTNGQAIVTNGSGTLSFGSGRNFNRKSYCNGNRFRIIYNRRLNYGKSKHSRRHIDLR
jgi:hypothetical protein